MVGASLWRLQPGWFSCLPRKIPSAAPYSAGGHRDAADRLNERAAALNHPPESASSESAETRQKPKEAERGESLVAPTSLSTCPDSRELLRFRTGGCDLLDFGRILANKMPE